jgi:hypothetical protein
MNEPAGHKNGAQHWTVVYTENCVIFLNDFFHVKMTYSFVNERYIAFSFCYHLQIYKSKVVFVHAIKAHGRMELWINAFLSLAVNGQLCASVTLLLGKDPQYPLNRRFDGPQNWSGCCEEEFLAGKPLA